MACFIQKTSPLPKPHTSVVDFTIGFKLCSVSPAIKLRSSICQGDGGLLGFPLLEGPATGKGRPVSASAAVLWGSEIATASSSCVSVGVNACQCVTECVVAGRGGIEKEVT